MIHSLFSKLLFIFFIGSISNNCYAQLDGFWDKEHSTTKEIVVNSRDISVIKSDDLPIGTTEIVYRITVLDENQQIASSLVSVLKSIPDPTGISQGSAGALFLLSKISGNDKCRYAIFTTSELASQYQKTGKVKSACWVQNNPINKEAKTLSMDKSACIQSNTSNLWFAFESDNWVINQKIMIEIVPWVDHKLSRGWTISNKKTVINWCKSASAIKNLEDANEYYGCLLSKIQAEFTYSQFQKLLELEKDTFLNSISSVCLVESGMESTLNDSNRKNASLLQAQGKFGDAITILLKVIASNKATSDDYSSIGINYIYTRQLDKALKYLKEGQKIDNTDLLLKVNLAHAYLLNNDYKAAKDIYKKYQNQNVTASLSWKDKIKFDFKEFTKAGIISPDYNRILRLLTN